MEKPEDKYPIPEKLVAKFDSVQDIIEDIEYVKAVEILKNMLLEEPDHPRVLVALAKVYFHMCSPGPQEFKVKSEEILLDVIERYPDLAVAHSFLGILYIYTGRTAEAAQYAQTALQLEPRSADGWNALGFYYAVNGDYAKALDYFLVAYTIDPSSQVVAYNVSAAYAKLGNAGVALEYLGHALKSRRLTKFIEKDDDFETIRDLPEYKKLISEAEERFGIEVHEEIYPIPEEIADKYNSVQDLIEDAEYFKAKETLESILEEIPNHPRVLTLLATVYWHLRTINREPEYIVEAEEILLDVIERFPDLAIAHSVLAIIYMRTGRRPQASEHAQIALKLEPRSCEAWNTLGFYYGLTGNYTEAIDFFLVAYTIDPTSRVAAFNVSGSYAKLGKTEAALEYLEQALASRRLLLFVEKDNDFNSLRDLPEYKRMISEAKDRFGIE